MKPLFTSLTIFLFVAIAQARYGGGTGEPNNPYLIYTAEHLNAIGAEPNDWDKHFKLIADIELSGFSLETALIAPSTTSNHWEFQGIPFTGVFDGNGNTISHLTIMGGGYLGFFGRLGSGAEVSNLRVEDVNITGSGYHIGGVVGSNNGGVITMCYSTGSVSCIDNRSAYVGGLLGSIDNSSGLRGLVTNCYSAVNVTGGNGDGGLIGGSYGPVDPYFDPMPFSPDPVPVINCYSTGAVHGESTVGGLVGDNNWSGSTLIHCYSTGAVNGNLHVGGLVGYGSGDVSTCFWNIETSGQKTSEGGTGKTTSEMQTAATFLEAGWDFVDETENGTEEIWWILEGQSYPRLWWQYGRVFSPYPQDGAVDVPQPLILSWLPGGSGLYHDVYFGEDKEAVAKATTESPGIYRGQQEPEMTTYDPGNLDLEKTYYWRIDEVNITDPNFQWKGHVWSFTTANFIIVDDFESYDADNPIWENWHDGLGFGKPGTDIYIAGNGTGSAVGDEWTGSYTEESIVYSGQQSMPYWYNNDKPGFVKYSEAEKTLIYPRDWTKEGVSELSLWFHGRPASVGSFVEEPSGTYTMTGSGTDIGGERDQFHFAYKMLTGPGSIAARIERIDNTHEWAKAGVMIRSGLYGETKHAFVYVTPSNGIVFQARDEWGHTSVATNQIGITAPLWLKLERDEAGNFTASHSTDGTTWQPVQNTVPMNISMSSHVNIGFAVTAHDANATCQAVFSNVTITGTVSTRWAHHDIGIASNNPEPMYVAVSNSAGPTAVVDHPDSAATQIDSWTEWVTPLSAFADQGIDLTNVDRITIGFGTRGNMTIPGGRGKMYFDDIRLYRPRSTASNDLEINIP